MKHVRLNASSRSRLVVAIRKEAEKQWLDAPAGRRMLELEDEMENAIAEQQAIAVPYADREVLARYGVGWTDTETARFVRTDIGMHTTTRTLFEQHPELVRFAGIVKVTPPPADPTGAIAAAEATVKAFGALG